MRWVQRWALCTGAVPYTAAPQTDRLPDSGCEETRPLSGEPFVPPQIDLFGSTTIFCGEEAQLISAAEMKRENLMLKKK